MLHVSHLLDDIVLVRNARDHTTDDGPGIQLTRVSHHSTRL